MINKSDGLQRDKVTVGGGRGAGETAGEGIGYREAEGEKTLKVISKRSKEPLGGGPEWMGAGVPHQVIKPGSSQMEINGTIYEMCR